MYDKLQYFSNFNLNYSNTFLQIILRSATSYPQWLNRTYTSDLWYSTPYPIALQLLLLVSLQQMVKTHIKIQHPEYPFYNLLRAQARYSYFIYGVE